MKKISSIAISITAILFILYSCKKSFLDRPAYGTLDSSGVANQKSIEALLIGAYSMLDGYQTTNGIGGWESAADNWVYGSICGGDAHKGSDASDQADIIPIEQYKADATNNYFNQKWKAVYEGVTRSNVILKVLAQAKDVPAADATRIRAEARFLRAHFHFELKKMWNNVPFIDETMTDFTVPNNKVNVPNDVDIWPKIEADLQFAYDSLPPTQPEIGRVNKWAAGAMLGKCLMFQKKYAEAKAVLKQVYDNGTNSGGVKYGLVEKFSDNFNAATKNNKETVFAVQSSVNDGSGAANANYGDVLNMPYGGPWDCCGFFVPSQDLVNSYKVDATTGLPDFDNYNVNPVKSDEGLKSDEPFTPYAGTLDPRLDWTVGRRGIPYLDWGIFPGYDWMRDQQYSGPYSPVKDVYYKGQKGSLTDNNFWSTTVTAINVNLIRFADVILWLAECEVEAPGGDLNQAREYVNEVRARAANPVSWVVLDGTNKPAANYKLGLYNTPWTDQIYARKAVHFERKLELAMEGHRFFDLVRWGEAAETLNKYLKYESTLRVYLQGAQFTPNQDEYFPIPQRQIDLSNGTLHQNPGH